MLVGGQRVQQPLRLQLDARDGAPVRQAQQHVVEAGLRVCSAAPGVLSTQRLMPSVLSTRTDMRPARLLGEQGGGGGGLLLRGLQLPGLGVGVGVGRDDGVDAVPLRQAHVAHQPRVALQLLACALTAVRSMLLSRRAMQEPWWLQHVPVWCKRRGAWAGAGMRCIDAHGASLASHR